ncbi:MAG: hypothetical protein ACD_20C00395G0002 [uncultured bacterium]|nr:MAG: hypothetical protein ACD_20C00395G0002 [uncultured bacterium]
MKKMLQDLSKTNISNKLSVAQSLTPVYKKASIDTQKPAQTVNGLDEVLLSKPAFKVSLEDNKIIEKTIQERLSNPEIRKAIMGALIYMDDTQVRNRPGKLNSRYDSSSGDGNKGTISLKIPFKKDPIDIHIPGIAITNEEGEWSSYIHLRFNKKGRFPVSIQDSNLFMTSFISYPLYLFDEKSLPAHKQIIKKMNKMSIENINSYKRGDAYNFWQELPGKSSKNKRTAPHNISMKFWGEIIKFGLKQPLKTLLSPITKQVDPLLYDWAYVIIDPTKNPHGYDSFLNIPNDADDTSVAVAAQKLYSEKYDPDSKVDLNALSQLEQFRDIDRQKQCSMDSWKGNNTGAFLTWLKDENKDIFATPDSGVIPSAVNLVDEVVNANAVFSMALNGMKDSEGYNSACMLIKDAVDKKNWQKTSIFYPQRMIFPYCASRAFRDGGADNSVMKNAMKKLLKDVLEDQRDFVKQNPDKPGAFPGGADRTTDLSTALGVIFLLNVGKDLANEIGAGKEYDEVLKNGVNYLLRNSSPHKIENFDTFNRDKLRTLESGKGLKWEAGLFFAGDPQNCTQWWSEAYTTAMALEALAKYSLAYDKGGVSISAGRRINIEEYARDTEKAEKEFKFNIS